MLSDRDWPIGVLVVKREQPSSLNGQQRRFVTSVRLLLSWCMAGEEENRNLADRRAHVG